MVEGQNRVKWKGVYESGRGCQNQEDGRWSSKVVGGQNLGKYFATELIPQFV